MWPFSPAKNIELLWRNCLILAKLCVDDRMVFSTATKKTMKTSQENKLLDHHTNYETFCIIALLELNDEHMGSNLCHQLIPDLLSLLFTHWLTIRDLQWGPGKF